MTDETQRIAIAEAVGWRFHPDGYGFIQPGGNDWIGRGYRTLSECCPDYLNDLNAMHAAEKIGVMEAFQKAGKAWYHYDEQLVLVTGQKRPIDANARQRAEAFLKTLGLWK